MKEEDKDLNYWKENAKDAYTTTPICVLRYITELEKAVKNNAVLLHVSQQREQLLAFMQMREGHAVDTVDIRLIDEFLKANNCG